MIVDNVRTSAKSAIFGGYCSTMVRKKRSKVTYPSAMFRTLVPRLFLLAAVVLVANGCNKEKDTIAVIEVVDLEGRPLAGAYVKLYANLAYTTGDASRLLREAETDSKGQAEFDYTQLFKQGQAGFAVLDILTFKDTMYAEGIIKILEEETTTEKLQMELIP
jgi:hypothetical protein